MQACAVMEERNVAFRVDAGPTIGIGHLRRCLTLAAALREQGYNVCFVCRERLGQELAVLAAPYTTHWLEEVYGGVDHRSAEDDERWEADWLLGVLCKR